MRFGWIGRLAGMALALATPELAWSADRGTPIDPGKRLELRLGAFAHGVGSHEADTVALAAELVSPRIVALDSAWAPLVPRLSVGGSVNLGGRTNFAHANLLWTLPVFDRFSAEIFVGPAVHDGSLDSKPNHAGLGCPVLFHTGASLGYRLTDRISLLATWEHLSNGREMFNVDCGSNQKSGGNEGLNNYGLRLGYSF